MDALYIYVRKYNKLPPALEAKPYPDKAVRFYLDVFYRLSASRQKHESGPQPLEIRESLAYLGLLGYSDPDDLLFALDVIQACDQVYLEIAQNKLKASREQMKNDAKLKTNTKASR